jgi:hypothetical protein
VSFSPELMKFCRQVSVAMWKRNPTIENRSAMIITTTWLGVIETRIRETRNPEERRKLIHEYNQAKQSVERTIEKLAAAAPRKKQPAHQELRRALP